MREKLLLALFVLTILGLNGCARIMEPFKTMWGSSTRVLERARAEAISKTYSRPSDEVFREIAKIAQLQAWEIFIKDKKQGLIDVMGVPGGVNTTEVGIFVSALKENETKVEVASLSTNTKRIAAETLFAELDKTWPQ